MRMHWESGWDPSVKSFPLDLKARSLNIRMYTYRLGLHHCRLQSLSVTNSRPIKNVTWLSWWWLNSFFSVINFLKRLQTIEPFCQAHNAPYPANISHLSFIDHWSEFISDCLWQSTNLWQCHFKHKNHVSACPDCRFCMLWSQKTEKYLLNRTLS